MLFRFVQYNTPYIVFNICSKLVAFFSKEKILNTLKNSLKFPVSTEKFENTIHLLKGGNFFFVAYSYGL